MVSTKTKKVDHRKLVMKLNDPRRCKGLCNWVYRDSDSQPYWSWYECINCGNKIENE